MKPDDNDKTKKMSEHLIITRGPRKKGEESSKLRRKVSPITGQFNIMYILGLEFL